MYIYEVEYLKDSGGITYTVGTTVIISASETYTGRLTDFGWDELQLDTSSLYSSSIQNLYYTAMNTISASS